MRVTVTYNVKSYDFFFKPIFVEFPDLKQSLLDDFALYKSSGQLPEYFGRDTDYARPQEIVGSGLMHIHLGLHEKKFVTPQGKPIDANTPQWDRTSDSALLYAQNLLDENQYSLIALFDPGAHAKAQDYDRMKRLAAFAHEFKYQV